MKTQRPFCAVSLLVLFTLRLPAQVAGGHEIQLRLWPAPLYWQPTEAEAHADANATAQKDPSRTPLRQAQTPVNSLVFVGMTPCRVVDTRAGQGFTGSFGPPSLAGQASRTFPIQSSATCSIPAIAQAYSFNVTVVPTGFLGFLTLYPTGSSRPNASTLNDSTGLILANAAVVPGGTSGSVDVFASHPTELIIDINGYYALQSGITLAQGAADAPSLSFSGDAGTGVFSSGAGTLNFTTAGTNRLTVRPDGDVDLTGSLRQNGTLLLHTRGGGANLGVGLTSLAVNTTGFNNSASGYSALHNNTTGTRNTATGSYALTSNTTGYLNTASGESALGSNTIGGQNTAVGNQALYFNTTGYNNTASGNQALYSNTTASYNTAFGAGALTTNTTGRDNTAAGGLALEFNTTGSNNTASGSSAMLSNTIGTQNTAVGSFALYGNLKGTANTAIGYGAIGQSTGDGNLALGYSAGDALSTGDYNILLANVGVNGESRTIRIGGIQTRAFISGIRDQSTGGVAVNVVVDSNGQLGTLSSSRRYKEDIQDMGGASNGLLSLRPVTFRYSKPYADGSKPLDYGLIAEEVADVYPDLAARGKDGQIETVQYHKLTPMLLNEVQKQHGELRDQKEQNRNQHEQIQSLYAQVAALRQTVEALLSGKTSTTAEAGR